MSTFVKLLSFSVCAALFTPLSSNAHDWAVLIGVDDYTLGRNLKYCVADQTAFHDHLIGSRFPKDQVFLLSSKARKKSLLPFKSNIETQLDLVFNLVSEGDVVIVSFSGHGVRVNGKSYLCPADADMKNPTSMISLDSIYQRLSRSGASMKLMLVDACRNDTENPGARDFALRDKHQTNFSEFARNLGNAEIPRGIVLLNSCSPGEVSWEDQDFKHGVFMHFVLQGLQGKADKNGNGKVSLGELTQFARLRTGIHVARKFNHRQVPWFKAEGSLKALEFNVSKLGNTPVTPAGSADSSMNANRPIDSAMTGTTGVAAKENHPESAISSAPSTRYQNRLKVAQSHLDAMRFDEAMDAYRNILQEKGLSVQEQRTAHMLRLMTCIVQKHPEAWSMAIKDSRELGMKGIPVKVGVNGAQLKVLDRASISTRKNQNLLLTHSSKHLVWSAMTDSDSRKKGWINGNKVRLADIDAYRVNDVYTSLIQTTQEKLSRLEAEIMSKSAENTVAPQPSANRHTWENDHGSDQQWGRGSWGHGNWGHGGWGGHHWGW